VQLDFVFGTLEHIMLLGGCSSVPRSLALLGLLLSLPIFASAQKLYSLKVSPHERTLSAETFAAEKLWVWQSRLNLQGWNITVAVARASELRPKTLGNIRWDTDKKTAVIHVLDPADYTLPVDAMMKDMEFTVVHELIHLELSPVLAPLQRSEENRRDEEHAVNFMAQALLDLDRGK
jgi:hypothetical protein